MKNFILFACVLGAIIVEGQGQGHNEDDADYTDSCACQGIAYQPVCGVDGQTYSNACEAKCAEKEFQCEGECPCSGSPSNVPSRTQKVCPFVIRKVCGENGTTFDNDCEAQNSGVKVQCQGECPCSENQEGNQEESQEDESCPFCCTSSASQCQGKRFDCSRCTRNN